MSKGRERKKNVRTAIPAQLEERNTINLFFWELQTTFQRLCFFWCISDKPPNPDRMLTFPCCIAWERRGELGTSSKIQRWEHPERSPSPLSCFSALCGGGLERGLILLFHPNQNPAQVPHPASTFHHQQGAVTSVVQECSPCQELPTSPCPDQVVVHFQTLPPLQASFLTLNPSRESLNSSLFGYLDWAWELLACSTPSFPHHPVEHTNHSQADTLLDPDNRSGWVGVLKPSTSLYCWLLSMPESCHWSLFLHQRYFVLLYLPQHPF